MNITTATVTTDPALDFLLARDLNAARFRLQLARAAQAAKDTPANREAVTKALADMDDVLDLYLLTRRP